MQEIITKINKLKQNLPEFLRQQVNINSLNKSYTRKGITQTLIQKLNINEFNFLSENLQNQYVAFQVLSQISFDMMDVNLTPFCFQSPQGWINNSKQMLQYGPYYNYFCDILYFNQNNNFRNQLIKIYRQYLYRVIKDKQYYLFDEQKYPIIQNKSINQTRAWLLQQQIQRILNFISNYFDVCTYTKYQAYQDFCCSYDVLSPIINNIYKIQLQAQSIILLLKQKQNYKEKFICEIIQHQIYLCRVSLYSFMRGIILISNQFAKKYVQIKKKMNQQVIQLQNQRNYLTQKRLVRDLSYLYQNTAFTLFQSMKRHFMSKTNQIIWFLKINVLNMPLNLIQYQQKVSKLLATLVQNKIFAAQDFLSVPKITQQADYVQSIFKNFSFQTIYTKLNVIPTNIVSFLSKNPQNSLQTKVKKLQMNLLKQKAAKYFIDVKQIFLRAFTQLTNYRDVKKKITQQNVNQKTKFVKILNYLRNVLINVINPIQQQKQIDIKSYYLLQQMLNDLSQKQDLLEYQKHGVIYMACKYQSESLILQFSQIHQLSLAQIKTSTFYSQLQSQQFNQIQSIYKQTMFYMQFPQSINSINFAGIRTSENIEGKRVVPGSQVSSFYKIYRYIPTIRKIITTNYISLLQFIHDEKRKHYPFALKQAILTQQIRKRVLRQMKSLSTEDFDRAQNQIRTYIENQLLLLFQNLNFKMVGNFNQLAKSISQQKSKDLKAPRHDGSSVEQQIIFLENQFNYLKSSQSQQRYLQYKKLKDDIIVLKRLKQVNIQITKLQGLSSNAKLKFDNEIVEKSSDRFKKYLTSLKRQQQNLKLKIQLKSMQQLRQKNKYLTQQFSQLAKRQKQALDQKQTIQKQLKNLKYKVQLDQINAQKAKQQQQEAKNQIKNRIQQQQMQPQFSQYDIDNILNKIKQNFNLFNFQTVQYIFKNTTNFQEGINKYFQLSKQQNKQQVKNLLQSQIKQQRKSQIKFPIELKNQKQYQLNTLTFQMLINYIIGIIKNYKLYPQLIKIKKKQMLLNLRKIQLSQMISQNDQVKKKMTYQNQLNIIQQELKNLSDYNNQINTIVLQFIKNIKYKWKIKKDAKYSQIKDSNFFRTKIKDLLVNELENQKIQKRSQQDQQQIKLQLINDFIKLKQKIIHYNQNPSQSVVMMFKSFQNVPEILAKLTNGKQNQRQITELLGSIAQNHNTSMRQYARIELQYKKQTDLIKCLVNKLYQASISVFKTLYLLRQMLLINNVKSKSLAPFMKALEQTVLIPQQTYFVDKTFGFLECFKKNQIYSIIQHMTQYIKSIQQMMKSQNIQPYLKNKVEQMNSQLFNNINSMKGLRDKINNTQLI